MGTDDGAIYNQVFHIRVMNEVLVHSFPDTFLTPAGEPLVDAVPVAIGCWQQAPLGAAAGHPEDGFHKTPAIGFPPNVNVRARAQESEDFRPLVVRQFNCSHTSIVPQMSTQPRVVVQGKCQGLVFSDFASQIASPHLVLRIRTLDLLRPGCAILEQ